MKHMILVYGGLGDLASRRITRALKRLSGQFAIEFAIVDISPDAPGEYYQYGKEPLIKYNAAIISTPNNTHKDIATKALDSGMHILCEKPLAHTLEAAAEIVEAADRHPPQVAMLSDHYVYKPAVREVIQNWVKYKARAGKMRSIKANFLESSSVEGREWLLQKDKSGGGVIMDEGIHLASIMGKLFGYDKIDVVDARRSRDERAPGDGETYGDIALNIDDIPAKIAVGKMMANTEKDVLFIGDKGQLEIDVEKEEVKFNGIIQTSFAEDDSYLAILKEFLSAIEGKGTPWTTLKEGYEALKIINAVYAIAKWEVPEKVRNEDAAVGRRVKEKLGRGNVR